MQHQPNKIEKFIKSLRNLQVREQIITKLVESGIDDLFFFSAFKKEDFYEIGFNMKERIMIQDFLHNFAENLQQFEEVNNRAN